MEKINLCESMCICSIPEFKVVSNLPVEEAFERLACSEGHHNSVGVRAVRPKRHEVVAVSSVPEGEG